MPRRPQRVLVGLVVLVVAIAAIGVILEARTGSDAKTTFKTARVELGDVGSSISATGVIQPLTTVEVKSNVGGRIDRLPIDLGQRVKKNQLIAEIDPTDPETQLDQAMARSDAATARWQQAQLNLDLQREQSVSQIAQAQGARAAAQARMLQAQERTDVQPALTRAAIAQAAANLRSVQASLLALETAMVPQGKAGARANDNQAQANMVEGDTNLQRQRELLVNGFVPQSTVDAAEAHYATVRAQVAITQQRLDTVDSEYETQLDAARARVARARAELGTAQQNQVQDEIRRQDYAAATAAVHGAQAQLDMTFANRKQIDVRQNEIAAAWSDVVSNQAAVQQAHVNMGFTKILAPRDGIVLQKPVEQGTVIASSRSSAGNGPTIVVLGDISRMFILCQVDETVVTQMIAPETAGQKEQSSPFQQPSRGPHPSGGRGGGGR